MASALGKMRGAGFGQGNQVGGVEAENASKTEERGEFGAGLIAFEFGNDGCGDARGFGDLLNAQAVAFAQVAQDGEVEHGSLILGKVAHGRIYLKGNGDGGFYSV